jgi:hypothetical protein
MEFFHSTPSRNGLWGIEPIFGHAPFLCAAFLPRNAPELRQGPKPARRSRRLRSRSRSMTLCRNSSKVGAHAELLKPSRARK